MAAPERPQVWRRARGLLGYLRVRPFDTSTTEGRSAERYRRAAWSTLAGVAARTVGIAVSLVSIPLAIGYLGPERYGLWVTVSALTAMLAFADLGLGNGLMNVLADANGKDDRMTARRAVSSALVMLTAAAALISLAFAAVYGVLPWPSLLNASTESASEAGPTVAVAFACFAINLPLGLIPRIQYGYQEGFHASLWGALGSLISLGGLIAAIAAKLSLPWLVLALMGGPLTASTLNAIALFRGRHPDLIPRVHLATRAVAIRLAKVGFVFFVLQFAVVVAYQAGVVIAGQILGPEAAAEYSVVLRLFFLVPTLMATVLLPLWPAYGEAISRGDIAWVRRTVVGSSVSGLVVAALASAILLVAGREILRVWVGPVFNPPFSLLLGMALWSVLITTFGAISMLLNGATVIRFQLIVAPLLAAATIGGSIALGSRIGISGVIWGTLLAYVVCSAIPTLWYLPRLLRRLEAASARLAIAPEEVR